jgi:hypothetical protein
MYVGKYLDDAKLVQDSGKPSCGLAFDAVKSTISLCLWILATARLAHTQSHCDASTGQPISKLLAEIEAASSASSDAISNANVLANANLAVQLNHAGNCLLVGCAE